MTILPATLPLLVASARTLNSFVRELVLVDPNGAALPPYEPGSHIKVQIQNDLGQSDWRAYSLVDLPTEGEKFRNPSSYRLAVRLDVKGRGGSRFMHEGLQQGSRIAAQYPRCDFRLMEHAGRAVLIAGGIGVTPLISLASQLTRLGRQVCMTYAARSRSLASYAEELQSLLGQSLTFHFDDAAAAPLNVEALIDSCGPQDHLYVCGPPEMLRVLKQMAEAKGWGGERVHFEVFAEAITSPGEGGFELVLAQRGVTLQVPPGQSVLQSLIDAGCDPMYDCMRGECGVCSVAVLDGEVEHRDFFLSEAQRRAGDVIQVCVSRPKGSRLILDL
ncbi:MAG: PDR/VanB family oxidoreductase [Betaproteobacteria bacterium]|jgi:ferredoxin-NADP reductase